MQKAPEVLNKAGDMITDFFKTKDWFKIEAKKEVEIDEDETKKLKDVMELKEKKPLEFVIDYKVLNMLLFGYSAKVLAGTKSKLESELEERKLPDLSKLSHNTESELEFELESESEEKKPPDFGMINYNSKVQKVQEVLNKEAEIGEDDMKKLKDARELNEKKPLVFGIDYKELKMLLIGYNAKVLAGTKSKLESELEERKPQDLRKLDMLGMLTKIRGRGSASSMSWCPSQGRRSLRTLA